MGLIRKVTSVSTLGVVKYRSNAQTRAIAQKNQGKAAKTDAKTARKLAQAEANLMNQQAWIAHAEAKKLADSQAPPSEGPLTKWKRKLLSEDSAHVPPLPGMPAPPLPAMPPESEDS